MAGQFRCVDAAVMRVAVLGGGLELPPWPDLSGDTPVHVREWRSWLRRVWEQEALVEAIEVASPRELGAYAHGPNAAEAADRFADQIRIWHRDHRHGPGPRLTVHPADTPDADLLTGLVIDRRHTRIVTSWPDHPMTEVTTDPVDATTTLRPMTTDTTREGVHSDQAADQLRGAMVDEVIVQREWVGDVPREVETALRTVPRHVFAPGVVLDKAYADRAIVTKRNERGGSISSVSAPWVQAMMLGQLQVAPGQRVLEIGSGGYNAALLRELVGPGGSVTTIDIDQEVADRALSCLTTAGYRDVRVLCGDGEFGATEHGPFDRIIVTVGTRDIPPAWVEQLADGGRLVVPLRTKGLNRSWILEHAGGYLTGRDPMSCGFVPMQGLGEHRGRSTPLHGNDVRLCLDAGQQVETTALGEVLSTPRAQAWSGVTIRKGENFSDLDLWLARLPGFCILSATQDAVDRGLVSPTWYMATPALVEGRSFAYRARLGHVDADETMRELGAYAHGPNATEAADRFIEQIRIWDRDHRHGPGPRLTVHPADTPDADLPTGLVIDRRHTRIVISRPDHPE